MTESFSVSIDPGSHIATVLLSGQDDGNTFSMDMILELTQIVSDISANDDIKALVLGSRGPNVTTGLDAAESWSMYRDAPGGSDQKVPSLRARISVHDRYFWGDDGLYTRLLHCPKITVLAAHGRCYDVGLYLALCSDIVIADASTRLAAPRWRQVGADGDLSLLINTVGLKRTNELVYCGGEWSADFAQQIGLVSQVVPRGSDLPSARDVASTATGIMRDGISSEKYLTLAALEKMHIGTGFAFASLMGGMASNIRYREGEFNFLKEARDRGFDEALRAVMDQY